MRVLKFGGSSLATPSRIKEVSRIVHETVNGDPAVMVVSAFQGVTDRLIECARLAERHTDKSEELYTEIGQRHQIAVNELFGPRERSRVRSEVNGQMKDLGRVLEGIRLLRQCPPAALDAAASFGERLSGTIVAAYLNRLRPARFADARQFIITDDQFTRANVLFHETDKAAREYFVGLLTGDSNQPIPVVTGFIGSTADGRTTTIGRNGSDYTAAIVGAALGASMIEIWTDVDGVLSADPKAVASAFVLPQITYEQAMEMSYFGAKVLHPGTIAPAVAQSIPILIKNTFNPSAPGTLISRMQVNGYRLSAGLSSVPNVTLFTLRGLNMVGVPGTAERLFRALASRGVNVMLNSQASSEHTMCFAVQKAESSAAAEAVAQEFHYELQQGLIALDEKPDQSIIAMIGNGMKERSDLAWKLFGALGRSNITVSAIVQGASERNISCIVDAAHQARALNVIHQGVFQTRTPLALVVVGVGNIGRALLGQLASRRPYLLDQGFDVRVVAVANSRRFVTSVEGVNLSRWQEELEASDRPMDARALADAVAQLGLTNAALVDCTADAGLVDAYPDFVNANLHIVTPNKLANVLPWARYTSLLDLLAKNKKQFFYEANVGAGLPIMSTLRDLVASGDEIIKVEGIFSGTLSYLFNSFDGSAPFSTLVREAHSKGLTEPDPREDLSGQDVSRKLLILARQIGHRMDLDDVAVNSLLPAALAAGPFSPGFFEMLAETDTEMTRRFECARVRGTVLRYVGIFEQGVARAGIHELPLDHPLATTRGSDNIIAFTTKRYSESPLVVRGPGAGADVTAMGVFSDILKLLHGLPR